MIISLKNKFILLSNPKCGSSTLRTVLDPYVNLGTQGLMGDSEEFRKQYTLALHMPAQELRDVWELSDNVGSWESYYKFTTVRNPFRKMVSWYFFLQPDKNFNTILDQPQWDPDSAFTYHFNDFMDNHYNDPKRGFLPNYEWFCTDWTTDTEGNRLVGEDLLDDVFKLEELDLTFAPTFKEKMGIELPSPLPDVLPDLKTEDERSKNLKFKGNPYDLYNQSSIEMVEETYKLELEKFDYKFGY